MYFQLSSKLVIPNGATLFSRSVSLTGANQVLIGAEVVLITGGLPTISIQLQEGNDQENWTDVASVLLELSAVGYFQVKSQAGISSQYVRLKYSVENAANEMVIVAAGIDTADL